MKNIRSQFEIIQKAAFSLQFGKFFESCEGARKTYGVRLIIRVVRPENIPYNKTEK